MRTYNPLRLYANLAPVTYLSALAHLTLEFSYNFLPVVYPLLIVSLGLSYGQVGVIALVGSLGATLFQPLFGYLSDRWDPRRVIVFSIAWIATLMGLVGFINDYRLLVALVGLGALGSAAYHPAGASVTTAAMTTRRGSAMSVFSVSGNLGSAFSPLVVGLAVGALGLRGTAVLIPIGLSVALFLALRFRSQKSISNLSAAADTIPPPRSKVDGSKLALALVVVFTAARSWYQGALVNFTPEWLATQGMTLESAGAVLSVLLFSISAGSLTAGPLSDRIGKLPIIFTSFTLLGPALWLFLNLTGTAQLFSAAFVGVMIGCTFPLSILLAQEAWPRGAGLASALVIGLGWFPAGIGSWLIGRLADQSDLTAALGTLLPVPLIGLAAAVLLFFLLRSRP
jgi:FSR family fosmidomycin resistance protein-like MFS transporter